MRTTIVAIVALFALAVAQTPVNLNYASFDSSNIGDFQLNGEAAGLNPNGGNYLWLVSATDSEAGTAFYKNTIPLIDNNGFEASFSAAFSFRIQNSGGIGDEDGPGADGITFALNTYSNSYGQVGDGIGYGGLPQSIAIELDTYNNGEPIDINGNHVGIDVNGNIESLTSAAYSTRMNDGNVHYVWVDYDGANKILSARISDTNVRPLNSIVSANIDLTTIFSNPNVYVGFTSGTGAGNGDHEILSFTFVNRFRPIGAVTTGVPIVTTGVATTGAILAPSCPVFDVDCNGLGFSVVGNPVSFLDYDFICLGNFNGNTGDIEGRLAVKGDLTLGDGFSIGASLGTSDLSVNQFSLVVGGNANWGSGALDPIGSFAYVGGVFTAPNDLLLQQVAGSGNLDGSFENARSCYATESAALATEIDNVDQLIVYGALTLTCHDSGAKDYFVTVDDVTINSITDYSLVGCNPNAEWIINVGGTGDLSFNGNNLPTTGAVYNIWGSGRTINVHTSIAGSVLSPNNNLNQVGGTIYGKVVVNDVISVLQTNQPSCPSFTPNLYK